jgi:hypothetical protein
MIQNQSTLVAFFPECYGAPTELLAALVPAGRITERIWEEALADRLVDLALKESDPEKATSWACRALDCPHTDDPHQIGEYIFCGNANFKTLINLSVFDLDPIEYFPLVQEKDNQEAREAIENYGLFDWVLSAAYFIGGDALDAFLKYEHKFPGD